MTVFVAHAPADRETAEGLEKFLERRGHFSEGDDGSTALRPITRSDVLVLLLSKDFVFATGRLRLEQRALDAWAEGRLIVVKLDHSIAPVGLRDLPALDASFEAQREFKWNDLANQIGEHLRAARQDTGAAAPPAQAPPAAKRGGGGGLLGALVLLLLALPGIGALAVTISIWLVNRIGPTPGGLPELRAGLDAFGARYGLPHGVTEWIALAAMALTLIVFAMFVARLVKPRVRAATRAEEAPAPAAPPPEQGDEVFVSYARANSGTVLPVLEEAKQQGRKFWIDQTNIGPAEGWAGEIVRAIRGAREVIVMCSKAAFESDHVKREIYLADRYHKKLVPVFIEEATPPEDFEYFFAGVQFLKLFETPEAERANVLAQALA